MSHLDLLNDLLNIVMIIKQWYSKTFINESAKFGQRIIDPTGTKTFAKERKFAKLLQELKSKPMRCQQKSTGFSRTFVTASLLCFGCFAEG